MSTHKRKRKRKPRYPQRKRPKIVEGLTRRAWNVLRANGLSLDDLKGMSEQTLLSYPNCGVKTARELMAFARKRRDEAPSHRTTSQHWLDSHSGQTLSVRARHVVERNGLLPKQVAAMTEEDFLRYQNCGMKTASELAEYAGSLRKQLAHGGADVQASQQQGLLQPDLFGETADDGYTSSGEASYPVLPLPLSKKARAYLTANGFKPNDPAEWELDRVMDELGPRSSVLGELAESKARWFLSQLTGLKVDDENVWTKRFPPERLVELYCTYRDIPFVGRLCGLGISEARMRLKRLRSWVPKLDAIRPGHLASEINALLPAEARDYDILISRNVPWGLTLEALAEKHGITRERVRQLELRERGYAIERYNCAQRQLIALPAVANAIRRERQQLSRERFDEMVLSEWGSDEVSTNEHVDATTAVIHILAGAPDEPADDGPAFAEAARIVSELPEPTWLPIRERNEIDNVTIGTRRDIKRRAFNEGAVDVTRLQRSFRLGRRAIGLLLQELGLEPIDEEFYVPALKGNVRRVPVLTTTSKLLQAGGPMHIEDVQLGLNRHAQRLKFVTVAPNVLEKVLAHYGCRIEGGTVRAVPSEYVASIGGVERVFVDFVRRSGPVVSFWELYEEVVLRSAYSVPSLANALCKFSAIVAPVDAPGRVSLYTIRGVKPSEPDLLAAIDRQHQVSGTIDYEHTLDGVRVSFEAATWLLTSGVQVLPDIDIPEGDWTVFAERDGHAVSATVSNLFMYGLPHVVKALSVRKGDPMELELDFLRRQAVLRRGEGEGDE